MRRSRRAHADVSGDATRRLQVVRVAISDPAPRTGVCARALRSCAAYLGNGLRLLGQTFSAGAWCDDAEDPPRDERGRGA
jgi:hypothetical protein